MFQLKTLGCLRLDTNGGQPVECPRRHLALLALLAGAGEKGFARERLAAHLWPDVPSENGRHSLEQLLSTLRGRLGRRAFEGTDPIRLNQQVIATDLSEFLGKLRAGDLQGASNLYGGPFVDGFYLDGSKEFEEWSDRERARLATSYIDALERLAHSALSRGELALAVQWSQQVVEADPLRAQGVLALMRALAAAGDRAAAVQHARAYERRIRDELDLPPEPAVIQLAEELQAELGASPVRREHTVPDAPAGLTPGTGAEAPVKQPPDGRKSTRGFLLRVGMAAALILAALFPFRSRIFSRTLLEPGWVLVADFEGPPDDPTLTRAVRELVSSALIESGRVVSVPPDLIREARRLAQIPDSARLTPELARHIAFRTAVRIVVNGSVTPIGPGNYSIILQLSDVSDGRTLASASAVGDEGTIITTSGSLAREVVRSVRPVTPESHHPLPVLEAATSSFDAYRRFVKGVEEYHNGNYLGAVALFREALQFDSAFAQAWLELGRMGPWIGDSADHALRQATVYADRLAFTARLDLKVLRSPSHADRIQESERIIQLLPVAPEEYYRRGQDLQFLSRYDDALVSLARAQATWPFDAPARFVAAHALALAAFGRFDDAQRVARGLSGGALGAVTAHIAMSSGNWAKAESVAISQRSEPPLPPVRRYRNSLITAATWAARGRLTDADRLMAESEADAFRHEIDGGSWHRRIGYQRLLPLVVIGNRSPQPTKAENTDTSSGGMVMEAIWSALSGNSAHAAHLYRSLLAKGIDEGQALRRDLLGLEAVLAWADQDWGTVTRVLSRVAYEGGGQIEGGVVFRRWLVADAYEQLGVLDSAAAFFEMIVTPVRTSWWENFAKGPASPFAHRRLALIYGRTGQHQLARRHWDRFLSLFTEPDPDLEGMVSEAKAELKKISD